MSRRAILAVSGALLLAACAPTEAAGPVHEEVALSLGVLRDAVADHRASFRITNPEPTSWDVAGIVPSCGCVRVLTEPCRVPPGGELDLRLVYEPRNVRGPFEQRLTLVLADGRLLPLARLAGVVLPGAFARPGSVWLAPGTEATVEVFAPAEDATLEVRDAPADLEARLLASEPFHGATRFTLELAGLPDASPTREGLRVFWGPSGAATDQEVLVEILRPRGSAALLANRSLVVPRTGDTGATLRIPLRRELASTDLERLELRLEPAGIWSASVDAAGLRLERLRELQDTTVTLTLRGPLGPEESLRLLPRETSGS